MNKLRWYQLQQGSKISSMDDNLNLIQCLPLWSVAWPSLTLHCIPKSSWLPLVSVRKNKWAFVSFGSTIIAILCFIHRHFCIGEVSFWTLQSEAFDKSDLCTVLKFRSNSRIVAPPWRRAQAMRLQLKSSESKGYLLEEFCVKAKEKEKRKELQTE